MLAVNNTAPTVARPPSDQSALVPQASPVDRDGVTVKSQPCQIPLSLLLLSLIYLGSHKSLELRSGTAGTQCPTRCFRKMTSKLKGLTNIFKNIPYCTYTRLVDTPVDRIVAFALLEVRKRRCIARRYQS